MFTCCNNYRLLGQPTWELSGFGMRGLSMVILAFYLIMIITSKLTLEEEKVNKINSLTAIVGLINIPIIKYRLIGGTHFTNQQVLR